MRVAASVFVALGLVAAVTGCSAAGDSPEEQVQAASECLAPAGDASDGISVEGAFGAAPEVTFDFPITADDTQRTVVVEGDGNTVADGDEVLVEFALFSATSGDQVLGTGFEGVGQNLVSSDTVILEGLVKTLQCSAEGSRVVSVIPPEDMWGERGFPDAGLTGTDSVVLVMDVVEIVPRLVPAEWTDDVPEVDFSGDVPVVTLTDTAPEELLLAVLEQGDGETVRSDSVVTIDYQGTRWDTGEIFDQSYPGDPIVFPASNFVKGFTAALVGQQVGSTVLVNIPAEHAYGADAAAHELGGQTLLFLIEIHESE